MTTLASQAALLQMAMVPASFMVLGGTGSPGEKGEYGKCINIY